MLAVLFLLDAAVMPVMAVVRRSRAGRLRRRRSAVASGPRLRRCAQQRRQTCEHENTCDAFHGLTPPQSDLPCEVIKSHREENVAGSFPPKSRRFREGTASAVPQSATLQLGFSR